MQLWPLSHRPFVFEWNEYEFVVNLYCDGKSGGGWIVPKLEFLPHLDHVLLCHALLFFDEDIHLL